MVHSNKRLEEYEQLINSDWNEWVLEEEENSFFGNVCYKNKNKIWVHKHVKDNNNMYIYIYIDVQFDLHINQIWIVFVVSCNVDVIQYFHLPCTI